MHQLFIESRIPGILAVNGFFCGPIGEEGQAFPTGKNGEIYIQLCPFGQAQPVTVALQLEGGTIARLEPQEAAYALIWPDGIIQLELIGSGMQVRKEEGEAANCVLLRYLAAKLAGDPQADMYLMRAQDGADVSGYDAVVPLRFAPMMTPERFDEKAGLMKRLSSNTARVDAALASTVPAGQGRRMIERVEIMRT